MIRTRLALTVLALVAGLAGAAPAQAGSGAFMIGSSSFLDRCEANGGEPYATGNGYGCALETVEIGCAFAGAQTLCEWDGPQNQRQVRRILGAAQPESLSEGVVGKGTKKGWGGPMVLIAP